MADWQDQEDEDDEYFAEILEGAEETGKEPKFVKIGSMEKDFDLDANKVDELIAIYRHARDQLSTDTKAYKQRYAAIKLHLSQISLILRNRGDMAGVDSFKTPAGTAYRNKKEKFTIETWDDVSAYVLSTGNIHMLQKRVSPNAVKEIRETDGKLPPGVGSFIEEEFAVRAPTARAR